MGSTNRKRHGLARVARGACATLVAVVGACDGGSAKKGDGAGPADLVDSAAAGGTLVIATVGDADVLVPPLTLYLQGAQVVSQLFDRLAEIGPELNTVGDAGFRPRLARGWTWAADSLSVRFALDPRARWHDGRPVTGRDVAFSFRTYTDPRVASPAAALLADVDSVSVPDSLTAVVWFARRSPQQFFDAVYHVYVLPEHLLGREVREAPSQLAAGAFARQPVGSGRFRFVRWEHGSRIELVADTANWRGRPQLDRVIWTVNADPGAATRALVSGAADWWESLRGDGVQMVERTPTLRTVAYPSLDQGFLAFNLRGARGAGAHPVLADRAVRRALAAAVDRDAVVRNALGTTGVSRSAPVPEAITGPGVGLLGPRFDLAAAARELDAAGWTDANGDGVRERGGRPLALRLLVPTTSSVRRQLAVLLQDQLKRVGAAVTVDALDPAAFGAAVQGGDWDLVIDMWHSDPDPRGVLQRWGAPGKGGRGGANMSGYRGAAVRGADRQRVDDGGPRAQPRAVRPRLRDARRRCTGGLAVRGAQRGRRAQPAAAGQAARGRLVGRPGRLAHPAGGAQRARPGRRAGDPAVIRAARR
jgi:peptide/nickel transport system substrate-binding protein